ncbi:MAG TPA: hypothetical protein PKI19_06445 [Elusimicrobiales bacterium]|nr:hypothetical protein [Elusimicrobiales bacterium]
MKKLLIFASFLTVCAPAALAAPETQAGTEAASQESQAALQRPDAQKIMSEVSQALKLSSRQEERIAKAVEQKTREFDKNMKEFEKNAAQEKTWLDKMNRNREAMARINSGMPDLVRDELDDEQRQAYDTMLAAKNKPAPAPEAAVEPAGAKEPAAPARKKRLVRRKKVAAGAPPQGAPAAAPGEEDGGVMVDKEPAPGKKRRVLRKKAAAAPIAEEPPAGPAGAAPTGKEAPAEEEDAGSYP